MPMTVRVAIIDASPEIRTAIASLLNSEHGVEIVAQAGSLFEQPLDGDHETDVLIMDFRACLASRAAVKALLAAHAGVRLIVTTPNGEREYREAMPDLAPEGWVQKTRLATELVATLRRLVAAA
jgi:DNA-binding NarL/FixJ family response regulator